MRALSLIFLLLPTSCIITDIDPEDWDDGHSKSSYVETTPSSKAKDASAAKQDKAKPDKDLTALKFSLKMAQRKLEGTELSGTIGLMEAERSVESAQRAVADAEAELENLTGYTAPRRVAQAELGLERSAGRLDDARAELQQIIQMYEGEEFAESSKELVINRSRRSVELSVELERQALKHLETVELPRDFEAAQDKVAGAQHKLRVAEMRLENERRSFETKRMEARESLRKAELALEKAMGVDAADGDDDAGEALQALGYLGDA